MTMWSYSQILTMNLGFHMRCRTQTLQMREDSLQGPSCRIMVLLPHSHPSIPGPTREGLHRRLTLSCWGLSVLASLHKGCSKTRTFSLAVTIVRSTPPLSC